MALFLFFSDSYHPHMCHIRFLLFLRTEICQAIWYIIISLVLDWLIIPVQELTGVAQSEELNCDLVVTSNFIVGLRK